MNYHYKTLGLKEDASQEEIKIAYDKLSKELDPANNDNLDFFAEEYQKIQEAYTALTGKKPEEKNSNKWFPATVPGCVHTDLMTNGIIEDPYYRLNESKVQWVDKKDWIYQNIFETSEDEIELQNHELIFEGLDTYASVYLNDLNRLV